MTPKVIGIAGKMGVGKTTTANWLIKLFEKSNIKSTIIPMGLAVKMEIAHMYSLPLYKLCNQEGKKESVQVRRGEWPDDIINNDWKDCVTIREILQWYGTEYRRKSNPDYWIEAWKRYVQIDIKVHKDLEYILVDDVRFENEARHVQENGYLFKLLPYSGWDNYSKHVSETSLDSWSWEPRHVFQPDFGASALHDVASSIFHIVN